MELTPLDQSAHIANQIKREVNNQHSQKEAALLSQLGHKSIESVYSNIDAALFWLENAGVSKPELLTNSERFNRIMTSNVLTAGAKIVELQKEIPKLKKAIQTLQLSTNSMTDYIDSTVSSNYPESTIKGSKLLDMALSLKRSESEILGDDTLSCELFALTPDMNTLSLVTGKKQDELQNRLNMHINKSMGEEESAKIKSLNVSASKINKEILPALMKDLELFQERSGNVLTHE